MNWRSAALIISCLYGAPPPARAAFELDDAQLSQAVPSGLSGNPATLAGLKCRRWATDHFVPFALRQLASTGLTVGTRVTERTGVGLGLRSSGFSLHQETSIGLGMGYTISHRADLGLAVAVQELRQPDLRRRFVGLTPGVRIRVGPSVELNVWYQRRGGDVPSKLLLSLRRRLDPLSVVNARWRQSTTAPARIDAIAERHLHPRLRLLVGILTPPQRFAGGAVLVLGDRYLSMATVTHPYLGLSPSIGMGNTCRAP
jgi:hypothetical protein